MAQLTFDQLEALWIQAGGSPSLAPTMAAIAMAESGGRSDALNNNPSTGDYSVGPWQINYYGSLEQSRSSRYGPPSELQSNPLADARAAVDLAAGGKGLGNWTTYSSGAYQQFLPASSGLGASPSTQAPPRPSGGGGGFLSDVGSVANTGLDVATFGLSGTVESLFGGDPISSFSGLLDVGSWFEKGIVKIMLWFATPVLRLLEALMGFSLILLGLVFFAKGDDGIDVGDIASLASSLVPEARAAKAAGAAGKARRSSRARTASQGG